jgi:alkanesulfonate monooxygenase SsuD/methylene tetrahydromethanopterin reductase-like flavin-dependent oxidoreductase (luciferase family)
MRFGLSLSGLLQHEGNADMVKRFDDVLGLVRLGRELGFDYVYSGHHYLTHPYQMLQPLLSLSRLSAETGDMDLLSTVLMPLQNPVQLAEEVATLDVLTNGHIIIASALGYRDEEYEAFGVTHEDRIARMLENQELMKLLWTGEEVTFHGRFTSVTGVHLGVKPVQKPHPRMWMTANGDGMVRRIARMGYVWYLNPHAPYDTLARQVEMYKAVRAESGFPPAETMPMSRETFVAETREKAITTARPFLESKYKTYAAWGQDKALPGDEDFEQPFEQLSAGRFIIGSPDDVITDLMKFKDMGVTDASLRFGWPGTPKEIVASAIRLAAKEVLPALR